MKKLFSLGLITAAVLSAPVFAEEGKETSLNISAELGILITTGNTETSSYLGKISADHELTNWKNKYELDFLNKEAEITDDNGNKKTEETDKRWNLGATGDYKFTDSSSAFVRGRYSDDSYGAYATYTTVDGGYGFNAISKEKLSLDLKAGFGFFDAETQEVDGVKGESESGELYTGSAAFSWQINDMTKFIQNVSISHAPALDNTQTITETGVSASFSDKMQMKFGFKTISNTEVAEGFEKTDTETSVTLVVNF